MKNNEQVIKMMNNYVKKKKPFLFIIDFECHEPMVYPLDELYHEDILFKIGNKKNYTEKKSVPEKIKIKKFPVTFEEYKKSFNIINANQINGDSYLLNLTFPTKFECQHSLYEIFHFSKAQYKLYYKNRFIVFSPETFVIISNNRISTFPMKGTIDATIPNAEDIILEDEKEFSEHLTIVDLMRNDLNSVAENIRVETFRYIEKIQTGEGGLLQVSSKITGELDDNYRERIGEIIFSLLPAGSISGAPKKRTLQIIREAENYLRGYYTGVFGIFDGDILESSVMIRFIEKSNGQYWYKSGGGITVYSDPETEYREMVDKIYVPIG